MARPNLGRKRICPSCSAKFYDLDRDPAVCPECDAEHPQANFQKPRRVRPPAPAAAPKKRAPAEAAEDDIDLEEDEDDTEDEDLEDDGEDLGKVVAPAEAEDEC